MLNNLKVTSPRPNMQGIGVLPAQLDTTPIALDDVITRANKAIGSFNNLQAKTNQVPEQSENSSTIVPKNT